MTEVLLSLQLAEGGPSADHAWLEQLFRDHHAKLCAFVYGYTESAEIAEDIVQELFLAMWRDPEPWTGQGSVRVLLYAAARNRALDYLRHRRVRLRYAQRTLAEAEIHTGAPAADDEVVNSEIREALDAAIQSLPERAREMFSLNRRDGLSYREIAERLGVSIKTVETQMSRSLKKLRAQLAIFLSISLLFLL